MVEIAVKVKKIVRKSGGRVEMEAGLARSPSRVILVTNQASWTYVRGVLGKSAGGEGKERKNRTIWGEALPAGNSVVNVCSYSPPLLKTDGKEKSGCKAKKKIKKKVVTISLVNLPF